MNFLSTPLVSDPEYQDYASSYWDNIEDNLEEDSYYSNREDDEDEEGCHE